MKAFLKKYTALLIVLALTTGVCGLFAFRKSGYFVDELYTFGLSNGYYTPFVKSIPGGDMRDQVITREELTDYVSVGEDDRFAFGSVYYNQTQDVHPPLYYWLFNAVSSLFPGFSKWPAMGLNYVIYMAAILVLWKLCMELFEDPNLSAAAAGLYGLSGIGVSTMLMVRMYVLLMLLTVVLMYLVARLMREQKKALYPLVGLTIFAGLMTQYYFVFYAFFLCAAYDIRALVKKDYGDFLRFSAWALAGALCLIPAFPACLKQLFADSLVSGGNAVENLGNVANYAKRFEVFRRTLRVSMWGLRYAVPVAAALALVSLPWLLKNRGGKTVSFSALLLILPAFAAYAVVVIISPVTETRYIYNIVPAAALLGGFLLHLCERAFSDKSFIRPVVCMISAIAVAWGVWTVRTYPPDYLYQDQPELTERLAPYSDGACVYFCDNYCAPLTEALVQLLSFDEIYVTDSASSGETKDYVNSHAGDELTVFIDVDDYWSSGYKPEEILPELERETGFGSARLLYAYGLSKIYILSR